MGHGEHTEAELTAFIAKRAAQRKQTEGKRPVEVAWAEVHYEMAARHKATLAALVSRHEAEAARYEQAS